MYGWPLILANSSRIWMTGIFMGHVSLLLNTDTREAIISV